MSTESPSTASSSTGSSGGSSGPLVASEGVIQAHGRAVVSAFHAASQALKLYPLENNTVQHRFAELDGAVRRLLDQEGVVELHTAGEFLLLNGARLRLRPEDYAAFSFLLKAMARHGIGTLRIEPDVPREALVRLLALLVEEAPEEEDAFAWFHERLRAGSGAPGLEVEPEGDEAAVQLGDDEAKEAAKRAYFQSVQVAREVLTDVRIGRAVNVRRVKRAVQGIVDQVLRNETSILGMSTLREFDEYTFTHSVNVCIFSLVLGQKLGLSKTRLYELGLGALFHDIGKMRLDSEIVNKTTSLTDDEWAHMKEHPTEGLLTLFSMRGFGEVPYRTMLMTYEHHMKVDLSGYPLVGRSRQPTLFSRIVAVADGFDAATSKRSYQSKPWTPDRVLQEMRDNPDRGYDPLLVKAFMNVIGIYPVGTLVILDTHELAVVVAPNADAKKIHQPVVKVLADSMGMPLAEPEVADLAEIDPETGHPRRTIIKTTNPEKYGIRVSDHFL